MLKINMLVLLLLFATSSFGLDQSWYYISNATESERDNALSNGCFHGSYGPIYLLSCNLPNSHFLATLPSTTYLCAVQTSHLEDFGLTEAPLLQLDDWYLLSSDSDYTCLDENVGRSLRVTVSPTPWKASGNYTFMNVTQKNPDITRILDAMEAGSIYQRIQRLSDFWTRQAQSKEALEAQKYLEDTYRGYGFTIVPQIPFRETYSSNVVAEKLGTTYPKEIIVIGAHYDSRSTDRASTTQRAPGADDNASGTAVTIELARVISELNVQLKRTLRIVAFSGEEQGLLGSRAYAAAIKQRGDNVVAMFNGDMLGWFPNRPGVPITLGMPTGYISNTLLASANDITRLYLPDLRIGNTTACCSDQQSFTENGYPAIGYFESTLQATAYPGYHNANDLPSQLNQPQLLILGRAIAASTLTYAQAHF